MMALTIVICGFITLWIIIISILAICNDRDISIKELFCGEIYESHEIKLNKHTKALDDIDTRLNRLERVVYIAGESEEKSIYAESNIKG